MDTLTQRIIVTLVLAAVGLLAYAAYARLSVRRAQGKRLGLESARPGVPTILYFTTPYCGPCRTLQAPALDRLAKAYGEALQVICIDAEERPDVASHWGVMTVPTTYVIDGAGKARFYNPGLAPAEKLQRQLLEAGLNS